MLSYPTSSRLRGFPFPIAATRRPRRRPGLPSPHYRPWIAPLRASDKPVAAKLEQHERAKNAVLWDALDLVSVSGTVGGAVLVALGYDLLFAALPIGLPVLGLFVGIRRERQRSQARDVFDEILMDDLQRQRSALENVQREITSVSSKIESLLSGRLKTFEEKLDRIDGTMISTSKNVRQLSGGLRSLPGIMKRISDLQQRTVVYAVSSEFRGLFEKWGTTQLQQIGDISNRLKFIEESIERLEAYDINPRSTSYSMPGPSAIDVSAQRQESRKEGTSVLSGMKQVVEKEISSVLQQLKANQVDMMQSLRDVRVNPIPQADYAFLEQQLERIEGVLGNLPHQLSETFKSESYGEDLKESYSKQVSAISAVVRNLERAIEELKRASEGSSQSTLELDVLEQKWTELRALMQSLSEQITGVNERMAQILEKPEIPLEYEVEQDEEVEKVPEPVGAESAEGSQDYLEFQDTTEPAVAVPTEAATNGTPREEAEWDVMESLEDSVYDSPTDLTQPEEEQETEESLAIASNGLGADVIEPVTSQNGSQEVVSKVGSIKVGLELLKKGRLALEEDYGHASTDLVAALEQFESILEVDPMNIQCLGNCGNTLLALGELKLRMSEELQASSADAPRGSSALLQLQQEAQQFLTLAGQRFKTLLENKIDDKRAYMNWGKALCMRASLADDPVLKLQLYDAAIVKYEQILSFDGNDPDALFFCGLALKESSEVQLGSPMDSRNRLNQAVVFFETVGRVAPSSPLQFEAFKMIQECRRLAGSPTLI